MKEAGRGWGERELTIDEIAEEAMDALDFGPEVMTCCEPDGCFCDMEPAELELARASIAYLAFQLLLMYRIKHGNVRGNPGGWVGVRHYESEIRKDIARVLGVRGTQAERTGEVRRLYKVAARAWSEDESYRDRLAGIMQGFEEEYDLDAGELGSSSCEAGACFIGPDNGLFPKPAFGAKQGKGPMMGQTATVHAHSLAAPRLRELRPGCRIQLGIMGH